MARLLKLCGLWLMCIPIFASAETVVVNASATGFFPGFSFPLDQFVNYELPVGDDPVPVTIHMSAEFDTDSADYSESDLTSYLTSRQLAAPATFTLEVGGRTFEYAGTTRINTRAAPSFFSFAVEMQRMSFDFEFELIWHDPSLSLSGDPLSPRSLSTADGLTAEYRFQSWPGNPDAPGVWQDSGVMNSASVNVLSAVPEPGQAGMLCLGMLIVLVSGRRNAAAHFNRTVLSATRTAMR